MRKCNKNGYCQPPFYIMKLKVSGPLRVILFSFFVYYPIDSWKKRLGEETITTCLSAPGLKLIEKDHGSLVASCLCCVQFFCFAIF